MLPVEAIPRHKSEGGDAERQRPPLFSPYIRHTGRGRLLLGAAMWGKKARVKSGRRKAPCPLNTGECTQHSPLHHKFNQKSERSMETPPFLYFTHPKKAKKKATANDTKGRCGNEFSMTL